MAFTYALRAGGIALLLLRALSVTGQPPVVIPAAAPASPVTAAEYFFDTDPGPGNGTAVALTAGQTAAASITVNIAALAPGVHRLYSRAKSQDGAWGQPAYAFLYIMQPGLDIPANAAPGNITALEYFFDNDPGVGNGTAVTVTGSPVVTLPDMSVAIAQLTTGAHRLLIRARDQYGRWSLVSHQVLHIVDAGLSLPASAAQAPIVKAEYFFDTDPGFSNGTSLPLTADTLVSISPLTSVAALAPGAHRYFARVQDQSGKWSITASQEVNIVLATIDLPATAPAAPVTALEYFTDTDPGFGNGNIVAVAPTANLNNYTLNVATTGLIDGTHQLFVRSLRPSSLTSVRTFYVGIPLPLDFTLFQVRKEDHDALLSWEVAAGFDANRFEVERSTDGKVFALLQRVEAPAGKTAYSLQDAGVDALGIPVVYYRIKAVAAQGKAAYTRVLALQLEQEDGNYAYSYPNPVEDKVTIDVAVKGAAKLELVLRDNTGRIVLQREEPLTGGAKQATLDLSAIPAGMYHITFRAGQWERSQKLVKQ